MSPIAGPTSVALTLPAGGASAAAAPRGDFTQALQKALQQVSAQQLDAAAQGRRFQMGDPGVSLEQTMVAMQTANVQFQALIQVRNRVVSAYQDIMNMQV